MWLSHLEPRTVSLVTFETDVPAIKFIGSLFFKMRGHVGSPAAPILTESRVGND